MANYEYWRIRCDLEQTPEALNARRLAHDAKRQFEEGDLLGAKDLYERSFGDWAKALAQFPELPIDSTTGSDLVDVVEEYVLGAEPDGPAALRRGSRRSLRAVGPGEG